MKKIIPVFLTLLISVVNLFGGTKILLSVDSTTLVVGQTTELSVTVTNLKTDSTPLIRNIDNFQLSFTGTSSNISIINGVYKSEKVFNYVIRPKQSGTFEIGPAVVKAKGKTYVSNIVKIVVNKTGQKHANTTNGNLFIVLSTDKKKVKLNEETDLIIKIYRRVNVFNMTINPPDMNSFAVYKIGGRKDYEDIKNGKKYYVSEFKYALFPTETGELTIKPFILDGQVVLDENPIDAFFKNPFVTGDSKHVSIPSNSLSITVEPLERDVYAVGDFDFTYSVNENNVKVGQSVTLTLKVFGYGNLNLSENIKLPQVSGLKYYPDKPSVKLTIKNNGLYCKKEEKIAIIPERAGKFHIDKIPISFYNPVSDKYENFYLPAITLNVLPVKNSSLKIVESNKKSKITIDNNGISTIKTDVILKNQNIILNLQRVFIIFLLPLICYLIIFLIKYFYLIKKANYRETLKNTAFVNLTKKLSSVNNVDDISNILREYFANRTENFYKSLTFKEIIEILRRKNIDLETVKNLSKIFDIIEQAQFAMFNNLQIEDLKLKISATIKNIDRELS